MVKIYNLEPRKYASFSTKKLFEIRFMVEKYPLTISEKIKKIHDFSTKIMYLANGM